MGDENRALEGAGVVSWRRPGLQAYAEILCFNLRVRGWMINRKTRKNENEMGRCTNI